MQSPDDNASLGYQIGHDDRITFVDSKWISFAERNKAPELTERAIVGKSIWNFVAGREVQHLYGLMFHVARSEGREVAVPFRCDSPTSRRFMELRVAPGQKGALSFQSLLVREEARAYIELPDTGDRAPEALQTICSWCKRLHLKDDSWVEIERAVRELGLFGSARLPRLTHGICPDCRSEIRQEIRTLPDR